MEISAGGIIINKEGLIVIVEQQHNSFSFPKGHIKTKEKLLDCAYREIYEETGILKKELKLIKKLGYFKRKCGKSKKDKRIHLFLFKSNKKKLKPIDKMNPNAYWVNINDAFNKLTHEKDKIFLNKKKKIIKKLNNKID
jgi:ADP-ribose pyrophosphatase YjhB (NUDIX family)